MSPSVSERMISTLESLTTAVRWPVCGDHGANLVGGAGGQSQCEQAEGIAQETGNEEDQGLR
jgi:hypothetical protein